MSTLTRGVLTHKRTVVAGANAAADPGGFSRHIRLNPGGYSSCISLAMSAAACFASENSIEVFS
jgi:hypothetical protein